MLFMEKLWRSLCSVVILNSYCCKRSKSFCNFVSSGVIRRSFRPWICNYLYTEYLNWVDMIRQNRQIPSVMLSMLSIVCPQTRFTTKVLAFYAFFPTPTILAEAQCYGLISKPRARKVSPILLLFCWANKRSIRQKSKEMDEEFTDLFVVETDEEKSGEAKRMQSSWHDHCTWSHGGLVFPLEGLPEFLFSQSGWDRGFPVLQLMAEKIKKFSENVWQPGSYLTPRRHLQTLRLLPWLLETVHVFKKQNTALLT